MDTGLPADILAAIARVHVCWDTGAYHMPDRDRSDALIWQGRINLPRNTKWKAAGCLQDESYNLIYITTTIHNDYASRAGPYTVPYCFRSFRAKRAAEALAG